MHNFESGCQTPFFTSSPEGKNEKNKPRIVFDHHNQKKLIEMFLKQNNDLETGQ